MTSGGSQFRPRVWAKPGPLTRAEQEQVRLHADHGERVLDACPALRPMVRQIGRAHV